MAVIGDRSIVRTEYERLYVKGSVFRTREIFPQKRFFSVVPIPIDQFQTIPPWPFTKSDDEHCWQMSPFVICRIPPP